MKVFHEAPIAVFEDVQKVTDGDYALVHLLETNEEYAQQFFKAKKEGREIILDNSVFELGEAYNEKLYVKWIEQLQPDWYIVPDVLENMSETVSSFSEFIRRHPNLPGKCIGVVQGSNIEEFLTCFDFMYRFSDKVAISFDYRWLLQGAEPTPLNYMQGRQRLMDILVEHGLLKPYKPIHLLGCYLPQEFKHYQRYSSLIDSLDTSNPCVHGLLGISYTTTGLDKKESVKLCELVNSKVSDSQRELILSNIQKFRDINQI